MGLWQEGKRFFAPAGAALHRGRTLPRKLTQDQEFRTYGGRAQRRLGHHSVHGRAEKFCSASTYRPFPCGGHPFDRLHRADTRGAWQNRPSGRSRRKAYRWADLGIRRWAGRSTYMQQQLQLQNGIGRCGGCSVSAERRLTAGEEKFVVTWLSWGFGEKEIQLAYEKTWNTGGLKWPYLNSILKSWHEQGLHDARADRRGRPPAGKGREAGLRRTAARRQADRAGARAIARMMQEED